MPDVNDFRPPPRVPTPEPSHTGAPEPDGTDYKPQRRVFDRVDAAPRVETMEALSVLIGKAPEWAVLRIGAFEEKCLKRRRLAMSNGQLATRRRYTRHEMDAMCSHYDLDPERDFLCEWVKVMDAERLNKNALKTEKLTCPVTGRALKHVLLFRLDPEKWGRLC